MESRIFVLKNQELNIVGEDRDHYIQYTKASKEERIKMRNKDAVYWKWFKNEDTYFKEEYAKFMLKIDEDPELADWEYDWSSSEIISKCHRVIAQRAYWTRHNVQNVDWGKNAIPDLKDDYIKLLKKYMQSYVPPRFRIRITKNITFNKKDVIPVFSDIPGETLANLSLHDVFVYEYGDVNFVDKVKEVNLWKAIEHAKEEQNMIKCTCTDGRCYGNENCPCYQVNHKLQEFQTVEKKDRTAFTSFNPILLSKLKNTMYDYVGFACSEMCACEGKCHNNSLLLSEKNVFPIEIYRNDPNVGFCIRSPVPIPAGTPFKTFVGEVLERSNLPSSSLDYAYEVWRNDELRMPHFIETETNFTEEYKNLLKTLFRSTFFVDPTNYGNVGRTAGHSCIPNVEILRVYQKSLSPAHANLVMVTLEDILPGTPLTIDYGKSYADRLHAVCGCGTFLCHNNEDAEEFEKMDCTEISLCLKHIHDQKYKEYFENVQSKVELQEDEHNSS